MRSAKAVAVSRSAIDEPWMQLLSELRHSLIGCAVSGIDGLVVGCNPAWNSVLRRPEPDSLGRSVKSLLRTTDDSIEAAGALERPESISNGACEFEGHPVLPGDSARCIAVSVARLERAGVPPHFLWQIVDVAPPDLLEARARQLEQVLDDIGRSSRFGLAGGFVDAVNRHLPRKPDLD